MAVHAALPQQQRRRRSARQATFVLSDARVAALRVTGLAQHRRPQTQHARMVGAVRIVTVATIFTDRRVFPKVGTALFGVALETGVVSCLLRQQAVSRLAMRVVTAAASHFSLPYRVRKRLHCLRALLLMTVEADFGLCRRYQYRISRRMTTVTIGASNFFHVVCTAVPTDSEVVLVTGCTELVLLKNGQHAVGRKCCNRRPLLATPNPAGMLTAWAMACLALQLAVTERRACVLANGVFAAKYGKSGLIVMAGETGICALAAIFGFAIVRLCQQAGRDSERHQ